MNLIHETRWIFNGYVYSIDHTRGTNGSNVRRGILEAIAGSIKKNHNPSRVRSTVQQTKPFLSLCLISQPPTP